MALYISDENGVLHRTAGNPKEQDLPLNDFYTKAQTVDFTSMTELYYSTSLSTGVKTLSDSLAKYKLLIIGCYNSNSTGWEFQTIPKILFDTLNSSSNLLWVIQGLNPDRRIALYKVSDTQINLVNIDNSSRAVIYGLK